MAQRDDKILQDIVSERYGGSAYHNFHLQIVEPSATPDEAWEIAWIAPRAVRIINNRILSTVVVPTQVNTLDIIRNIGAGTNRTVITQFDPDTLVADTVTNRTLSTASADGNPHVVANQYHFFAMILALNAATTGPFNINYMAHFSFEDL
jgi:hypothetical protein